MSNSEVSSEETREALKRLGEELQSPAPLSAPDGPPETRKDGDDGAAGALVPMPA
jgi:hypothetical protein